MYQCIKLGRIVSGVAVCSLSLAGAVYADSGNKANPDISLNALMIGRVGNKGQSNSSEAPNGFQLQEVEARFTSNVDTYFRADAVLAVEKEPGADFAIAPEEVYVESLSIPYVTIKAGKFYAQLGRQNAMHTHAFAFIDRPLVHDRLLGEEGLNEVGVSAAVLLPTSWYSEFVAHGFSATNEELFNPDSANAVGGNFFYKNLWDLADDMTLELDLNYVRGPNAVGSSSNVYDVSATYKWRPVEKSREHSLALTSEYLRADQGGVSSGGLSTWVQYQFLREWWLQGRMDYLGFPAPDSGAVKRYTGLVGFVPSEFSAIRLQYDAIDDEAESKMEHRLTLQLNISIGAHPAHEY